MTAERDLARLHTLRERALRAASVDPAQLAPGEYREHMDAIGDYLDALKARLPWIAGTILDPRRPPSYTHRHSSTRKAVFDAPFVCSSPGCDEAAPSPPDGSAEDYQQECSCPRCEGRMLRAPWAECVPRSALAGERQ